MPTDKLFIVAVRWNQMLLLCHRGRAETWPKHGGPSLHGRTDFIKPCWMLLGQNAGRHDARLAVCTRFFTCKCSNRGPWFSRLVHIEVQVMLCTLFAPNTNSVHGRWPFSFFPCHAVMLNTNAVLLCARHSWEQAVLFLGTRPQLHISNPGPIGN